MKKIILVVLIAFITNAKAQYVTIPDAQFVRYLQGLIPSAMSGNKMDTTNFDVTNNIHNINTSGTGIVNYFGLQYFKSLWAFDCSNNSNNNA